MGAYCTVDNLCIVSQVPLIAADGMIMLFVSWFTVFVVQFTAIFSVTEVAISAVNQGEVVCMAEVTMHPVTGGHVVYCCTG